MTLRTPRRRIAPRTIRRYRAIKQFFRRALGSISQADINTNSSRTDNVIDLKHKIRGLEQQLSEVSQHCRDIIGLESTSGRASNVRLSDDHLHPPEPDDRHDRLNGVHVIYKTPTSPPSRPELHDYTPEENDECNIITHKSDANVKKKKSKDNFGYKEGPMAVTSRKVSGSKTARPNLGSFSTSSLLSEEHYIRKERQLRNKEKCLRKQRRDDTFIDQTKLNLEHFERYYQQLPKRHKILRKHKMVSELDQDFIADIIKRQYRPMKMFGRRESNLSQVSAPICRDHDQPAQDNHVCSCSHRGRHKVRRPPESQSEHSDAISICDTRLYSSQKYPRLRHHNIHKTLYDDCELYDLVPVKEKSSPKSRRKFVQDNMNYSYYKEVPPSPKTHRPRLNLKAQYYSENEDVSDYNSRPIKILAKNHKIQTRHDGFDSDTAADLLVHDGCQRKIRPGRIITQPLHDEVGTTSGIHHEIIFNKTQDTDVSEKTDKTDKALCEIKDILQNFLQEIKKESSSLSGKSDVSTKVTTTNLGKFPQEPPNTPQSNSPPTLAPSTFSYSVPPCSVPPSPYMPSFSNPCCYPLVPVYPVIQNGCPIVPTASHTCPCASQHSEKVSTNPPPTPQTGVNPVVSETDELIKEIYRFIAQSPTFSRKQSESRSQDLNEHKLTSRSAGGSAHFRRLDANVGTPDIKCSKSYDGMGCRLVSESFCSGASYSETILENISLEATGTTSDTDLTGFPIQKDMVPKSKLANMLKSLFKKKRADVIEELSESESGKEQEHCPGPFGQNIVNYSMYEQEYYKSPPVPSPRRHPSPERLHPRGDYHPPYHPGAHVRSHSPISARDPYRGAPTMLPQSNSSYLHSRRPPSVPTLVPPYDQYSQMPQTPLCIKEIEVKSTGTQSEKKTSFFKKFQKTIQAKAPHTIERTPNNTISTQTIPKNKSTLFKWKGFEPKVEMNGETFPYSYIAQKKLVQSDEKIRKTLLKKMFYRRNPFSPTSLIFRTLLGKNKASYGAELPKVYRPKMFI